MWEIYGLYIGCRLRTPLFSLKGLEKWLSLCGKSGSCRLIAGCKQSLSAVAAAWLQTIALLALLDWVLPISSTSHFCVRLSASKLHRCYQF